MLRITDNQISSEVLYNLNENLNNMAVLQNELSSGKTFSLPSDAPTTYDHAAYLTTTINANDQYVRNTNMVDSWVKTTSSTMESAQSILQQVRTLAVQAANGNYNAGDRQAMADQVYQLRESLRQVANTQMNGQYIFGGIQTNVQPYPPLAPTGGPPPVFTTLYNTTSVPAAPNNNGTLTAEMTPGNTINYNTTGVAAFGDLTQSTPGTPGANTFAVLDNLYNDMVNNNQGNISKDLGDLDNASSRLIAADSVAGSVQNRVELTTSRIQSSQIDLKAVLSQVQDADMAQVITSLNTQENVYKASLSAGAQAIQPTLMDYLK